MIKDKQRSIFVVVTTYRPDNTFIKRFSKLVNECNQIVVCDNTPGGFDFGELPDVFHVLASGKNIGLGSALNNGLTYAKDNGATHVVLFDQDSTPLAGLLSNLIESLFLLAPDSQHNTCIGPTMIDDESTLSVSTKNNLNGGCSKLKYTDALPTSGMSFSLKNFTETDHFTTDLFLDWVDHEWCYRLGEREWKFAKAQNITMFHRLGEREEHFMGKRFFVPTPFRHYFQVRDGIYLAFKKYVPLKAKLRIVTTLPGRMVLYPFILEKGSERLKWMFRGLLSACLKETGSARCSHLVD